MIEQRKYVIQRHQKQAENIHWDLMLESLDGLETYRLDSPPEQITKNSENNAIKTFTHDRKFLTYEGAVNKGAGSVKIAEAGTFQQIESSEQKTTLKFQGQALKGLFEIVHIKDDIYSFNYLQDQAKPFLSL